MKRIAALLLLFFCMGGLRAKDDLSIAQVVIWGHKLHSHTHSYIHAALYKAFSSLGYKTLWLDNNDDCSSINFSHSLFITEGQADQKIPLREDCYYILHNCSVEKYHELKQKRRCITWQVYTHDCRKRTVEKREDCIYIDKNEGIIYMPWATDLLPDEIDAIKVQLAESPVKKLSFVGWVGTISDDKPFDNRNELTAFKDAAVSVGLEFHAIKSVSMQENIKCMQSCLMAPALQGHWQVDVGYIPCRIFKNISYGQLGITNSETVYKLFGGRIVYNPDCKQLFFEALKRLKTFTQEELFEHMDFVKNHHTYLNRIERLLDFLKEMTSNDH